MNTIEILSKYQNYLLGLAIFLALFAVSNITVNGQTKLILKNYPVLIILLIALSILIALVYIRIDKRRIKLLSSQIKVQASQKSSEFELLVTELTSRQKEVYGLIISGKSNKEIMAHLFIEQSTLKTHINHIYKKLKIKNRKELISTDYQGKT